MLTKNKIKIKSLLNLQKTGMSSALPRSDGRLIKIVHILENKFESKLDPIYVAFWPCENENSFIIETTTEFYRKELLWDLIDINRINSTNLIKINTIRESRLEDFFDILQFALCPKKTEFAKEKYEGFHRDFKITLELEHKPKLDTLKLINIIYLQISKHYNWYKNIYNPLVSFFIKF